MSKQHPEVPRVKLVAPNVLSAVSCAEKWLPPLLAQAGDAVDVIGTHDYDRRGDRWRILTGKAGGRPVWLTEWCVNGHDKSPNRTEDMALLSPVIAKKNTLTDRLPAGSMTTWLIGFPQQPSAGKEETAK